MKILKEMGFCLVLFLSQTDASLSLSHSLIFSSAKNSCKPEGIKLQVGFDQRIDGLSIKGSKELSSISLVSDVLGLLLDFFVDFCHFKSELELDYDFSYHFWRLEEGCGKWSFNFHTLCW